MNWPLLKNSLLVGGLTTLLAASFGFVPLPAPLMLTMIGRHCGWRDWRGPGGIACWP